MQITIDKLEAHPPHAFSAAELRAFLRAIPPELLRDVSVVRLSSATKHTRPFQVADFSRLNRRLVIVSRGLSRDRAMREVILSLVRNNLREARSYGCGPTQRAEAEVDAITTELLDSISPKMPPSPHWNRVELRYVRKRLA